LISIFLEKLQVLYNKKNNNEDSLNQNNNEDIVASSNQNNNEDIVASSNQNYKLTKKVIDHFLSFFWFPMDKNNFSSIRKYIDFLLEIGKNT
jgi:hypothetical protein